MKILGIQMFMKHLQTDMFNLKDNKMKIKLNRGGEWLGKLRERIKWDFLNGDTVHWGSDDKLKPEVTVKQYEEAGQKAIEAFMNNFDEGLSDIFYSNFKTNDFDKRLEYLDHLKTTIETRQKEIKNHWAYQHQQIISKNDKDDTVSCHIGDNEYRLKKEIPTKSGYYLFLGQYTNEARLIHVYQTKAGFRHGMYFDSYLAVSSMNGRNVEKLQGYFSEEIKIIK